MATGQTRCTVLVALWLAAIVYYGWLKIVVLFVLACAVLFVGSVVAFGIYDAIRTRNDREPRPRHTGSDEELDRLRQMAGLDK
jgi:hypothetical protein